MILDIDEETRMIFHDMSIGDEQPVGIYKKSAPERDAMSRIIYSDDKSCNGLGLAVHLTMGGGVGKRGEGQGCQAQQDRSK